MLDSKRLSPKAFKILRDAPYQLKVMTFDLNCGDCPFVRYIAVTTATYSGKEQQFNCGTDVDKATRIAGASRHIGRVIRRCTFNEASMEEVVLNGCKFWSPSTCESSAEDAEFIEVSEVGELVWQIPR